MSIHQVSRKNSSSVHLICVIFDNYSAMTICSSVIVKYGYRGLCHPAAVDMILVQIPSNLCYL